MDRKINMAFERPTTNKAIDKKMGELRGRGLEKSVWDDKDDPEKIIAVYHRSMGSNPETIKARKYFMDILHMLYPEHFTKVYSVGAGQHERGIQHHAVLQRLDLDENHQLIERYRHAKGKERDDMENKVKAIAESIYGSEQFKKLKALLEELGMEIDSGFGAFEQGYGNFTFNQDGTIRMIEMGDPFYGDRDAGRTKIDLNFDDIKLRKRIEEKLNGTEKKNALMYLDRIIKLSEELENRLERKNAIEKAKWERKKK